jgi:hypothetical protein
MKNFIKKVLTVVIIAFVFIIWLIPVFCISAVLYCLCWVLGLFVKSLLLTGLVLIAMCYNGFVKGFSIIPFGEFLDYFDKIEKKEKS